MFGFKKSTSSRDENEQIYHQSSQNDSYQGILQTIMINFKGENEANTQILGFIMGEKKNRKFTKTRIFFSLEIIPTFSMFVSS